MKVIFLLIIGLVLLGLGTDVDHIKAHPSSGTKEIDPEGLLPGDIILLGSIDSSIVNFFVGTYEHTAIYCGKVHPDEQIWDRTNKVWIEPGTDYVIHSTKSEKAGNGIGYDTFETVVSQAKESIVLRVLKPDGIPLTAAEREAVVDFLKSQLSGGKDGYPVGPAYDWGWTCKQELATEKNPFSGIAGYYCSEAAWGAYKHVLGIDLDSETTPFNVAVSPDDLLHSQFTSVVACKSDMATFSAGEGIYKLTVFVDEICYDIDYDPWPRGAGEEYIKSFCGDFFYPTKEVYPGSGKIGLPPKGCWPCDGQGSLDWNKYFNTLINYARDVELRIEAWEYDDIDPDDQYPAWQLYLTTQEWHQYIDKGWFCGGFDCDLGDCSYTVYFRIESVAW